MRRLKADAQEQTALITHEEYEGLLTLEKKVEEYQKSKVGLNERSILESKPALAEELQGLRKLKLPFTQIDRNADIVDDL